MKGAAREREKVSGVELASARNAKSKLSRRPSKTYLLTFGQREN
jgi:hypothetical protein